MFHLHQSSTCSLNFYLVPLKRNYSIVSYIFTVKWSFNMIWTNTVSPGCNLLGNGLSLGSPLSHVNLRFVAAISNIFFIASKERTLTSFPKDLMLGSSNVFRGNTGSLPNMRKKGDSFGCSFGMKLMAAHVKGTKSSHSSCGAICLAIQAFRKA